MSLSNDERRYFISELRSARQNVLKDSEAWESIVFTLEKLGALLNGPRRGLGDYRACISDLAKDSPLHTYLEEECGSFHVCFDKLFHWVRQGRNDAMHQGVFARSLAIHAVELALIIEDAIMIGLQKVSDLMVRNPVCAEVWQPLSFIRQTMLTESFSFLPVLWKGKWYLISDVAIATYLRRGNPNEEERRDRLSKRLEDVLNVDQGLIQKAESLNEDAKICDLVAKPLNAPALVTRQTADNTDGANLPILLGIITAFDLL